MSCCALVDRILIDRAHRAVARPDYFGSESLDASDGVHPTYAVRIRPRLPSLSPPDHGKK